MIDKVNRTKYMREYMRGYRDKNRDKIRQWSKACYERHKIDNRAKRYAQIKNNTKGKKKWAVQYKGGKCEICGYNKCAAAMDFHHPNGTKKSDIPVSRIMRCGKKRILEEIDKCQLLCANCHREKHFCQS